MADTAVLEARLEAAETALHELLTGMQAVKVDYDGTSTEFTRSSEPALRRYIASLKRQLGQTVGARRRRVIY